MVGPLGGLMVGPLGGLMVGPLGEVNGWSLRGG